MSLPNEPRSFRRQRLQATAIVARVFEFQIIGTIEQRRGGLPALYACDRAWLRHGMGRGSREVIASRERFFRNAAQHCPRGRP